MSESSSNFLYAGLDRETNALALELESMGGGDAALGRFEVHAVIDERLDPKEKSPAKVLWVHGKTVGIRDAFLPKSAPSSDIMSYVSLSSTSKLANFVQNPGSDSALDIPDLSDWVLDGFNACVLSYGSRGLGKSLAFFGNESPAALAEPVGPGCVAPQIHAYDNPSVVTCLLRNLYEKAGLPRSSNSVPLPSLKSRMQKNLSAGADLVGDMYHRGGSGTTLGVSCWAVYANRVVDLCVEHPPKSFAPPSGSTDKAKDREYAVVECPSLDAALAVVATARSRCRGVQTQPRKPKSPGAENLADSMRAHFFLRVLVHRESSRDLRRSSSIGPREDAALLSHVHVVDLIGTASPEADPQFPRLSEADRISRREHALQLQALARTLGQMKSIAKSSAGHWGDPRDAPTPALVSGRDSLLTSILCPIIRGNCRTVMAVFMKDGEFHYRTSKATLAVCEGLSGLPQPCHRVSGVPRESLGFRSVDTVLPMKPAYVPQVDVSVSASYSSSNLGTSDVGSQSLDDSVAEYQALDLMGVAAGEADMSSPDSKPVCDIHQLAASFKMELESQRHSSVNPQTGVKHVSAAEKLGFSYAQFVDPDVPNRRIDPQVVEFPTSRNAGLSLTLRTLSDFNQSNHNAPEMQQSSPPRSPSIPPQPVHRERLNPNPAFSGNYRCVHASGIWVQASPATDSRNIKIIEFGDDVDLSEKVAVASDNPSVVFSQLRVGGWVKFEENEIRFFVHHDDLIASASSVLESPAPESPAPESPAPESPAPGSPAPESPAPGSPAPALLAQESPVPREKNMHAAPNAAFSPLPGGRSLLAHASEIVSETTVARQIRFAPPSINVAPTVSAAVSQASLASKRLLKAKAGKDRVAAQSELNANDKKDKVKEDFRQKLLDIYAMYNPAKVSDIPDMLINFQGREAQILADLHRKYKISGSQVPLSPPELDEEEDFTATVVYSYGSVVRDIPSGAAASLGNVDNSAKVALSGRSYRPPNEDGVTYAELQKSSVAPRGGWIPIVLSSGARVLDIPGYNYELMKWPDSRSSTPTIDSPEGSGSDASVRRTIDKLATSLINNSSPKKHVTVQDGTPLIFESDDRKLTETAVGSLSPVMQPRALAPVPYKLPASLGRPSGVGQPDKTGPLALSEAGMRALAMARAASAEQKDGGGIDIEPKLSPASKYPPNAVPSSTAKSHDTSFMSSYSAGDTTLNGEVDVLRRNTASLMEALNLERTSREKSQKEIRFLQAELEEARATLELARGDHQLTERRLRSQLKSALEEKDMHSVFSLYEEDIDRGRTELDLLRQRNMELELLQLEAKETGEEHMAAVDKHVARLVGATAKDLSSQRNSGSLKIRKLMHENEQLVLEMASLKQMKRQYALGLKVSQDSAKKQRAAVQEIADLRMELEDARSAAATARNNYDSLNSDRRENLRAESRYREDNEALQEEIGMLRARVKEVDEERWRQLQFDSIAGANSTVPDLLPTEGGSAAGVDRYSLLDGPSYAHPTESSRSGRANRSAPISEGAAALETAISELHEGLVSHAPFLLPLLRRVGNGIHYERTRHLQNRADMISTVFPIDGAAETPEFESPNLTSLASDEEIARAVSSRHHHNVDVATSYAAIQSSRGIVPDDARKRVRELSASAENATQAPRLHTSAPAIGVHANVALSALRKHRKELRDAHALRTRRVDDPAVRL